MSEKLPERPLECSECRKKIAVIYTEAIGGVCSHLSMCDSCPEYEKRLKGGGGLAAVYGVSEGTLACGLCGTTLDAVRMGNPLGCSLCYDVFAEALFAELVAAEKIPSRISQLKKTAPLHIGRAPGEAKEATKAIKLLALNEALSDTLKAENYEQAALLRDQIRAITEKKGDEREAKPESPKENPCYRNENPVS